MKQSYESIKEELAKYIKVFTHTHVNNGRNDACKRCGLDLRDEIHTRIKNP